jgi:hypothetical protein
MQHLSRKKMSVVEGLVFDGLRIFSKCTDRTVIIIPRRRNCRNTNHRLAPAHFIQHIVGDVLKTLVKESLNILSGHAVVGDIYENHSGSYWRKGRVNNVGMKKIQTTHLDR